MRRMKCMDTIQNLRSRHIPGAICSSSIQIFQHIRHSLQSRNHNNRHTSLIYCLLYSLASKLFHLKRSHDSTTKFVHNNIFHTSKKIKKSDYFSVIVSETWTPKCLHAVSTYHITSSPIARWVIEIGLPSGRVKRIVSAFCKI